jgi:hypothetical protein
MVVDITPPDAISTSIERDDHGRVQGVVDW